MFLYHMLARQAVDAATALPLAGSTIQMANGDVAAFTTQVGALSVEGAEVIIIVVKASDGIVHAIDVVLTPPAEYCASKSNANGPSGYFFYIAMMQRL